MSSTTDAIVEVAKNIGPAVTGIGGALATLWKTTRGIFDRLKKLEEEVTRCKSRFKELSSDVTSSTAGVKSAIGQIEILGVGLREHEQSLQTIRAGISSLVTQTVYAKTLERLSAVERHVCELRGDIDRLDKTLVSFAREQNEQWHSINRSLGQLEGYIKGQVSMHD